MRHTLVCPPFDYKKDPLYRKLRSRAEELLVDLRRGALKTIDIAKDTRPAHRHLFQGMTPKKCGYYAGNYRGEPFKCLKKYVVMIGADPRVGSPPGSVPGLMSKFSSALDAAVAQLDATMLKGIPEAQKTRYVVRIASAAFQEFLTVHPYADGNGHAGRFLVWALLGRYGLWPERWKVEPRPPDPPYSSLISDHRSGKPLPLELYILTCIVR